MQHKAEAVSRSSCQEKVRKGSKVMPLTYVASTPKEPEPPKPKNVRKPRGVKAQSVNTASKTEKYAATNHSRHTKSNKTVKNLSKQVSQASVEQPDKSQERQHGLPLLSAQIFRDQSSTDQQDTCPQKNISTMNKGGLLDQLCKPPASVPEAIFQVNEIASSSQTPINICRREPEPEPFLMDGTDTVNLSSDDEERSEIGFGEHISNSQREHEMFLVQEPEPVILIEGIPIQSELAHVPVTQFSMQLCPIKSAYAPYATLLAQQGVTPEEQTGAENAENSSTYAPMILEGDSPTLRQMRFTINNLTQSQNSLVPWHRPTNFVAPPSQTMLGYQQTNETPPFNSSRCMAAYNNIPQLSLASQSVSFQTTRHQPTSEDLENQNRAMQTLAQTYLRKFSQELEDVLKVGGRQNLPAIQANQLSYGRSPATLPMIFDSSNRNQAMYSDTGARIDRSNGINKSQFQYPTTGTHQINQSNAGNNRSQAHYPTLRHYQMNQDKADTKRNQFQYMSLRNHQIHQGTTETQRNRYLYPPMAFHQMNQSNANNNTNHLPYPPMGFYQANQANAGYNRSQTTYQPIGSHQVDRGSAGIYRNNRTQVPYPSMEPYQKDRGNLDKLGFTNYSNKQQNQLHAPEPVGAHTDSTIGDESSSFCLNSNRMYPRSTPYSNFLYPSNQTLFFGSGYQNRDPMNMSSADYRQSASNTPANFSPHFYQNYHNYTNIAEYDPRARR